jgi:hypothetical protein
VGVWRGCGHTGTQAGREKNYNIQKDDCIQEQNRNARGLKMADMMIEDGMMDNGTMHNATMHDGSNGMMDHDDMMDMTSAGMEGHNHAGGPSNSFCTGEMGMVM